MQKNNSLDQPSALIVKYLTDSLSAEEQEHFQLWLDQSADHVQLVESFRDTGKVQADINAIHSFDAADAWKNVSARLQPMPASKHASKRLWGFSAAAAVLICGALGALYLKSNNTAPVKNQLAINIPAGIKKAFFQLANGEVMNLGGNKLASTSSSVSAEDGTLYFKGAASASGENTLATPRAGEYKLVLPDGTQVWLNASSSLRFANTFNRNDRQVYLNGEAYFEVAHNRKLPFRVNFNNTEVEVLGTHFNINTYDSRSRTTLLEGSVKITENGKRELLKPGEEATVGSDGIQVAKVETFKTIAWKEGLFLFEEENMADILDQVARWYDVKIKYDGAPGNKKYSGNIRRQANLNQVLEMLTAVSGSTFTLTDRTLTVKFN